jgi:hypothetical protein
MEPTVYESRARELIGEIKRIIEVKGIDLQSAWSDARISEKPVDAVLGGEQLPSLPEFIALCQISGITFHLPSIETPDTAM